MAGVPPPQVYLAPGFDPMAMKVAQLRGILAEHGLGAPSNAKKADLVELFEQKVRVKAQAWSEDEASVVPSNDGIVEIDNDGREMTPPPVPKASKSTKRLRKSVKPRAEVEAVAADEVEQNAEEIASRTTRKTRRSSQAPSSTGFSKATSTPFGFSAPSEDEDVFADDGKGKSKSKGRSLKKIASMGQLREDADEALEEQREKGRGKARKSEGDASAPEASRHGLPRKSSVSRTKEEEGGFSDFNPFQAVGDEPAESSKKAKELKKRRTTAGDTIRRRETRSVSTPEAVDPDETPRRHVAASAVGVTPPSLKRFQPDLSTMRTPPDEWRRQNLVSPVASPKVDSPQVDIHVKQQTIEDAAMLDVARYEQQNQAVNERISGLRNERLLPHYVESGGEGDDDASEADPEPQPSLPLVKQTKKAKNAHAAKNQNENGSRSAFRTLFTLAALGSLLAWTYQYRQESVKIGFCDADNDTNSVIRSKQERILRAENCRADRNQLHRDYPEDHSWTPCDNEHEIPLPLIPVPHDCAPCPSHARCSDGKIVGCNGEYILESHPLSALNPYISGLPGIGPVAFPPSCELDYKRRAQVGEIAKAVEGALAKRKGDVVCGVVGKGDKSKSDIERFGLQEQDLQARFAGKAKIPSDEFKKSLKAALDDLVIHKNIINEIIDGKSLYMATRAEMTLGCRLRLAATEKLIASRNKIAVLFSLIGLAAYLTSTIKSKRAESARVKELVRTALLRLQDQSHIHYIDPSQALEPFLKPDQLRDYVLSQIHNPGTRQRLWGKVQPVIEMNSNVNVAEREVGGDTWKIWEWVGVSKTDLQHSGGDIMSAVAY